MPCILSVFWIDAEPKIEEEKFEDDFGVGGVRHESKEEEKNAQD